MVFHASQLKRAVGDYSVEVPLPAELEVELEPQEKPKAVLVTREVYVGGSTVTQWLVQRKGRPANDTMWEDESMLRSQFPKFSLEVKADVP